MVIGIWCFLDCYRVKYIFMTLYLCREREKALDVLTKGMQLLAEMEAVWG